MKKRILIIEDELQIRMDISRSLHLSGYDTIEADNGATGLELANKLKPELIISDIMMPHMNGFDLIKELQKNIETAGIPFLFLSAKSNKSDIREGMNLGADDFITKPFDIDELINAVNTRLRKKDLNEQKFVEQFEELRNNIRLSLPHEIRTPLSVILGFTEFLLKKFQVTSPHEIENMLESIKSSAERLNSLFENYLLYANLELIATNNKDKEKLISVKTFIPQSVIENVALYKAGKYQRMSDLEYDLDSEDISLQISEEYLVKILEEIVDNSFKFSIHGAKVSINTSIDSHYYSIIIIDYGRGMTNEQIAGIGAYIQFERKVYEQQGTGLGLIIAKRIIELHNGNFTIESETQSYTKVTIRLPLASN